MTRAREIMTAGTEYLKTTATAEEAATRLASVGIGVLPVCEPDGHLAGMVTDRDIVTKVVAAGKDPKTVTLADIADQPEVVTIGADESTDEVIETMKRYQVRRLPVIDGNEVIGIISQGDIARSMPVDQVGGLVAALSS